MKKTITIGIMALFMVSLVFAFNQSYQSYFPEPSTPISHDEPVGEPQISTVKPSIHHEQSKSTDERRYDCDLDYRDKCTIFLNKFSKNGSRPYNIKIDNEVYTLVFKGVNKDKEPIFVMSKPLPNEIAYNFKISNTIRHWAYNRIREGRLTLENR